MGTVVAFPLPEPPEEPQSGSGKKPSAKQRGKKRGNGQGSIYQRKSDGRWVGAAYVLIADGTYKRTPVYGASAEEVENALTTLKNRSNQGLPAEATGWTVAAYAAYWLDQVAAVKLRPRTLVVYRSIVERYVLPAIGKKRLTRLTPQDVRLMLARVSAAKRPGRKGQTADELQTVSARTVQQVHAVLRSMLSHAMREEAVSRNVARLVQVPSPERDEIQPWTDAEARQFLSVAREHRWYALFAMALGMGLRKAELLGLRWADVDLGRRQVRVSQTLQRVRGQGVIAGPPKSRSSRRSITMPELVVAALRRHQALQRAERAAADADWQDTGLVFTTATGRHVEARNLSTTYERLIKRAGVRPIRFHDLRHTCATLLLLAGVSPRVVMEILGHSQIAVTMNTYGHVLPAMQHDAADRMDGTLSDPQKADEPDAD